VPIDGPRLVVVLGCTVGAGQTVTTLMLADLLAGLRNEPVAALDFNSGPASLAEQARVPPAATVSSLLANGSPLRPAGHLGHLGSRGRGHVDVIAHNADASGAPQPGAADHRRLQHLLAGRYPLTLADPGAAAVARLLAIADQLVLVAPASPDASQATAMTQEWLQSNGYGVLTAEAVVVINGVSKRSMTHTEQAEAVVRGRCRAIVRVPWDDHLGAPPAEQGIRDIGAGAGTASRLEQLRPPVLQAYTALAGVLVSALATSTGQRRAVR
jgi:MinD-like ATPase involved in chromosome partitioning or flagellar assembly